MCLHECHRKGVITACKDNIEVDGHFDLEEEHSEDDIMTIKGVSEAYKISVKEKKNIKEIEDELIQSKV